MWAHTQTCTCKYTDFSSPSQENWLFHIYNNPRSTPVQNDLKWKTCKVKRIQTASFLSKRPSMQNIFIKICRARSLPANWKTRYSCALFPNFNHIQIRILTEKKLNKIGIKIQYKILKHQFLSKHHLLDSFS